MPLPFTNRTGTDPDAAAYFATANITDPTAKQQINSFVKRVKSLGLWNNIVCWPLRSGQNASSTLNAKSLGGLGRYDGTFVGLTAGSWTANGLFFNNPTIGSNTQYITLPTEIGTSGANTFNFGVASISGNANFSRLLHIESGSPGTRNPLFSYGFSTLPFQCDLSSGSTTQVSAITATPAVSTNVFGAIAAGVVGNNLTVYNNSSPVATAASTNGFSATSSASICNLGEYFYGTIAAILIGRFDADATLVSQISSLYKNSLGLGLP